MDDFQFLIIDTTDRRLAVAHWVNCATGVSSGEVPRAVFHEDEFDETAEQWIVVLHRNDTYYIARDEAGTRIKFGDAISDQVKRIIKKAEIVVAYTGGSGGLVEIGFKQEVKTSGLSSDPVNWFAINRAIVGNIDDPDEEKGIKEIILWAQDPNRSYVALPRFLRHQQSFEYTTSLSLLCQGYLAQYALNHRSDGGGVDTKGYVHVGRALNVMGWVEDEAAEKVYQTVVDLDSCAEQPMPGIAFWADPFEGSKSLRDGIQSELPKSLSKLPDDIESLVKAIEDKNISEEPFVSTVAKAYLKLNELLEAA